MFLWSCSTVERIRGSGWRIPKLSLLLSPRTLLELQSVNIHRDRGGRGHDPRDRRCFLNLGSSRSFKSVYCIQYTFTGIVVVGEGILATVVACKPVDPLEVSTVSTFRRIRTFRPSQGFKKGPTARGIMGVGIAIVATVVAFIRSWKVSTWTLRSSYITKSVDPHRMALKKQRCCGGGGGGQRAQPPPPLANKMIRTPFPYYNTSHYTMHLVYSKHGRLRKARWLRGLQTKQSALHRLPFLHTW